MKNQRSYFCLATIVAGMCSALSRRRVFRSIFFASVIFLFCLYCRGDSDPVDPGLQIPAQGQNFLHIISPTVLELELINTEEYNASQVNTWDWVDSETNFVPPNMSSVQVLVNGQGDSVTNVGFKRRPIYAPLTDWDLRIASCLYLELSKPISAGQSVQVLNNGTVWPTNMQFAATADPLRYSPGIHVNQEGYLPAYPKKAAVGFYLGNLGELPVSASTFSVVNTQNGATVYQGTLTQRPDVGYEYNPTPYQQVYEADFSSVTAPGQYRVLVPGMGGSLPFLINDGIAMDFARTYALGIFEQRSGTNVSMPYTRFTHAADHITPASVPTNANDPYVFTWTTISNYAVQTNPNNPNQTAPIMTNPSKQLYPFVNAGPLDVSGGHFEAGDYNRVTENSTQLIHFLLFGVDALPGVAALDNLGIPESGDGISDILQEVKWEADYLAKLQDKDGGFYYSVYSIDREYETDVLPENGDPQVVWPKNTACTAASVAALAECSSSPLFKKYYPQAASNYWAKAQLGWKFLTNAITQKGLAGAYQKIQGFGDDYTDVDERSWAACEMYLATGDPQYQQKLFAWFPNPADPNTFYWGWWSMYECYGNAVRDYATAVSSGRLQSSQVDSNYLALCIETITNCGNATLQWSQDSAYGSSFPDETKAVLGAGWYFSPVQAYDLVVAQQFNPNPAYVDAIIRNLNFEGGCNPLNMTYITGLGSKRQREIVDQFSQNFFTALPKDGIPISNIQQGFDFWSSEYGWALAPLCFPSDGAQNPYPMYDRWCDIFNVTTEASTTDTARSMIVAAWLAAQTTSAGQHWTYTNAMEIVPASAAIPGQPVTIKLQVSDTNLTNARITWEALDQEPTFGGLNYTFTPDVQNGPCWVEAEVQWPDGRRAFATNLFYVSADAPPQLSNPRLLTGGFTFQLTGTPQASYVVQASTDLAHWQPIATNTLPTSGILPVNDPQSGTYRARYYRAVKLP